MGIDKTMETGLAMERELKSLGLSMYGDDIASKILAYVAVYGGGNEAVTQNAAFCFAILACKEKFNLIGGEVPIKVDLLVSRIDELARLGGECSWLIEVVERYSLHKPGTDLKKIYTPDKFWQQKAKVIKETFDYESLFTLGIV
jgi:hypothetical protein